MNVAIKSTTPPNNPPITGIFSKNPLIGFVRFCSGPSPNSPPIPFIALPKIPAALLNTLLTPLPIFASTTANTAGSAKEATALLNRELIPVPKTLNLFPTFCKPFCNVFNGAFPSTSLLTAAASC